MIPKTSPLHAVYQLLRKKQYRQAVALANFYPRSDERRTLELLALLQLGGMDDAAAVVPEKAEELPALALQLRELSVELGLRWEMLPVPARAGENSYLKYLCLDLIGTFRSDTASTAGYALRTLARRGIQDRNWLFARICLQRALEVDQSPLGLVEAAKLVNGITRKGEDGDRWQGQPALELVQEALARATPENSTADLFPDAAFLLLTLDPAAEERAAEVVRRAAGWFPQQRRVILAGCVRRAREARDDNPDLAARMDMLGTELIDSLVEYLSERSGHLAGQLGILQEERHVYRTAAWYREGQERVAVLLLLERATDADLSARLHHLMNLKAYPTEWRADWLVYALSRPVALSDDERDEVLRWAETLPPKSRLALLRVLRQHPGSGRLGQRPSETTIHVSGEQNLVLSSGRDVVFSIDSSFSSLNASLGASLGRFRHPLARTRRGEPTKRRKRRVERYTRVRFPETCTLEQKAELKIQLTARRPADTRVPGKVAVEVEGGTNEVELKVVLTAPEFATDEPVRAMKLPVAGDSEEVVFRVFPLSKGQKTLEVEIFHDAERVTYLLVCTRVDSAADAVVRRLYGALGGTSDEGPAGDAPVAVLEQLHPSLGGKPSAKSGASPRRMLHVTWTAREDRLACRVIGPDGSEEFAGEQAQSGLHDSVCDELRRLNEFLHEVVTHKDPTDDDWDALQFNLRAKGQALGELLLPAGLLETIRQWPAGSTLVVDTNEQWIPWEILYDGADFLGLRFVLARAPRYTGDSDALDSVRRRSRPGRTVSHVVNVVGGDVGTEYAQRAAETFAPFSPPLRVETLREKPVSALDRALSDADCLHLTCHGHADPHLLQIDKRISQAVNLLPESVRRLPLKRGSIVFANACGSDRALVMFGNFTSFGWEFYRRGADVFIGTLGAVPTVHAVYFAEQLYARLLGNAKSGTIGAIVSEARRMAGARRNLFSLLYCLYGDPDTRVRPARRTRATATTAEPAHWEPA